jgi:hypothetical protein
MQLFDAISGNRRDPQGRAARTSGRSHHRHAKSPQVSPSSELVVAAAVVVLGFVKALS